MSYLLFADDNEDMRAMMRDMFKSSGHEVAVASDGIAALAAVQEREPDLMILDHSMPRMSGFDVCRSIKRNPFTARIPVLMLTAQAGIEDKVEGFAAGADDYLAKPFDPRELRVRVQALLRLVQREGDRNPTSGLPGGQAIEREIARRVAAGEEFEVSYLDLDNFKAFADTFGFATADEVIRALATSIRASAASISGGENDDFVGHVGGDDFIVVTRQGRGESIARATATEFRSRVEQLVGREVAESGTFSGLDRSGKVQKFPLAAVSTAVLVVRPATWINIAHFGMVAADVKRRAKQRGSSAIIVEAI